MAKNRNKAHKERDIANEVNENGKAESSLSDYKSSNSKDLLDADINLSQKVNVSSKSPIFLKYNAYKRMLGYALRYADDDIQEKSWKEVYGILIGSIEKENILSIKDAIPMVMGDRAGVKYENKQYVDMAQIDESIYEKSIQDRKNDFIIGWWHTHPGFKFMFSDVDMKTQLGYQIPNPLAIGLIFNHMELKSNEFYLGLAALRIKNPDQGILATYDYVEIKTEYEKEKMVNKALEEIKGVKKNIDKVIKEINYIDQILRRRYLAQLQRNYGLIVVPRDQIILTDNPDEAEDDERILYEWDPEFHKKRYRIPKFREKIEKQLDAHEKELLQLSNSNNNKDFETKRHKFQKKIKSSLAKPGEWLEKINKEFTKRVEIISPFFDYLDTNERKVIEMFESRSSEYRTILNELQSKAEFIL